MDKEQGLIPGMRRYWRVGAVFLIAAAIGAVFVSYRIFSGHSGDAPPGQNIATTPPVNDQPAAAANKSKDMTAGNNDAATPTGPSDNPAAAVISQAVMVDARPAALLRGQGKWEDVSKTIADSLKRLNDAVAKAGLEINGRAITVFTKTDDTGFTFEAMLPLTSAPDGKLKLADGVEIGASPAGRALKFQHHGAYDEIEATYEAIAAYLDEKGLDSKDLIIEEYLGDFREDDDNIDVDIYVFLK